MVTFMYKPDWTKGCPGTGLGVSVKVFPEEVNTRSHEPSKAAGPPQPGGQHPIH
jgi:hypothetical protein